MNNYPSKTHFVAFSVALPDAKLDGNGTLHIPLGYVAVMVDAGTVTVFNPQRSGFAAPRFSWLGRHIKSRSTMIYFIRTRQVPLDFPVSINGKEYTLKTIVAPDVNHLESFVQSMGHWTTITTGSLCAANSANVAAAVGQVKHSNGEIRSIDLVRHKKAEKALKHNGVKLFTSELTVKRERR